MSSRRSDAFTIRRQVAALAQNTAAHVSADAFGRIPIYRKASCACGGGCPACQAKSSDLNISQPNDPAEIEADQIADRVMRMADREPASTVKTQPSTDTIHRACSICSEAEDTIQRKPLPSVAVPAQTQTHVQRAIDSGGQRLDHETCSFFEPRLGYDLSSVRIHTGSTAAESARAIDAQAYTLGNHIVFGSGEYQPESESGTHLLAHELVHVAQQDARHILHRKLKVDEKASDDPPTALSTIQPLVKALCPDFHVAKSGTVEPNAGTESAKLKFDKVAKGKQPVGCCCLSTLTAAPGKEWKIIVTTKEAPTTSSATREVRMTPTAGLGAPELRYWTGGAPQTVQSLPFVEAFGHELCGHAALMQIKAHPSDAAGTSDRAYSDVHDPTVQVENALATEMGLAGTRRGLAGSGSHRGESLRVFSIGPYGADADDPVPHAAQIKAAVDFLDGNERLMVDEVGFSDKADTKASVGKSRADKVEAELKKGIKKGTVDVETTPGVDETLARVQPGTDGGAGAAPVVELRMVVRPAGLMAPIGAAPPAVPVHVDPESPAVVKALKAGKKVNACHALLSATAWP